ncbi:hypothetical protein IEE86_09500 [Bacillus sp. 28A-2]|uniref:hypothetical protein n=1 Tax=Bacillus sp. 28A-2 TaxID=2772252 RepID=UPI00168D393A|nr:hypothetical protein [Bacillus sp. 28A-2]MBD3859960.1 hypothetical protein [Bacillus sp. 28A-2]
MIMKFALFTAVTCVFIALFLMANPFGGDAMRMVSAFIFPFLGLAGFGILLFDPLKKAAK